MRLQIMIRMLGDDDYYVVDAGAVSTEVLEQLKVAEDHRVVLVEAFEIRLIGFEDKEVSNDTASLDLNAS